MNGALPSRHYVPFDPRHGYPFGSDLLYECLACASVLPSLPRHAVQCTCGNLRVGAGHDSIDVQDPVQLRIFETPDPRGAAEEGPRA